MSTVKLEVGAWYRNNGTGTFYQILDDNLLIYSPKYGELRSYIDPQFHSGPYHIEPGDRVKPKPSTDKCWLGVPEYCVYDYTRGFTVDKVSGCNYMAYEAYGERQNRIPLSCLILVRKAEQNPSAEDDKQEPGGVKAWTVVESPRPGYLPSNRPNEFGLPNGPVLWPNLKPVVEVKLECACCGNTGKAMLHAGDTLTSAGKTPFKVQVNCPECRELDKVERRVQGG